MNIEDCEECRWISYDPLEHEEICMLHDEQPIDEIESCNANELSFEAETLIIEEQRGK